LKVGVKLERLLHSSQCLGRLKALRAAVPMSQRVAEHEVALLKEEAAHHHTTGAT